MDVERRDDRLGATFRALSLPVLTGLLVRAIPVVTTDFPLNDGGLFYKMTQDLMDAGFVLPATTDYNGLSIPFAYPPLAFYLAGVLSGVFGLGLLDVFRFLPFAIATAMIPVAYLVAREILATRFQALLATWAFALLPRAFDWLILGGGLTRSLGMLFALLAVLEGIRFYRTNERRHGAGLAVFAALTVLSHPQAALFAGLSMILLLLAYRRTWRAFRDSVVLALVAAVLTAPWWLTVIASHGIEPFVSGGQTGSDLATSFHYLVTFTFTDEPYETLLAVVGMIGTVYLLAHRRFLLPAWIFLVFALDPRGAATELMVVLAMIIAIAVDEVLLANVARLSLPDGSGPPYPREFRRDPFARTLLIAGLVLAVIGGTRASTGIASPLHALAPANRDMMAWIEANTPPETEFLVITGDSWFIDADSEWFPVLTSRRSLATVQGYEWLGKESFDHQLDRNFQLQGCIWIGPECVDDWIDRYQAAEAWLYVGRTGTTGIFSPTGDCCASLRSTLAMSPDFVVAFQGPGGAIFRPAD